MKTTYENGAEELEFLHRWLADMLANIVSSPGPMLKLHMSVETETVALCR